MKSIHLLHHGKVHQDNYKRRDNLPLEAQLNCHCNNKAKEAVLEGIMEKNGEGATLPMESVSAFIRINKQTWGPAKGLRYYIGKATA